MPQAVEGGTGVLVDGDFLVRGGRFVLTCATSKNSSVRFLQSNISKQQLVHVLSLQYSSLLNEVCSSAHPKMVNNIH